jgi:hypothetical protein
LWQYFEFGFARCLLATTERSIARATLNVKACQAWCSNKLF